MTHLWRSFATLLLGVLWAGVAGAQSTPLIAIYGMRDKAALERVVREYEELLRTRPDDSLTVKALGIAHHNLGALKVSGAVDNAVRHLERARTLLSGDAEVLVYLGSARTMVARDSWNPITKVGAVREGTKLIDMTVSKGPDNVTVRFVRANNSLRLPRFFNRAHYAKTDLVHLLKLSAPDGAKVRMFSPEMVAEIHFKLGEVYKDENDEKSARQHWTKAVEIAPDSEWSREAKKRL